MDKDVLKNFIKDLDFTIAELENTIITVKGKKLIENPIIVTDSEDRKTEDVDISFLDVFNDNQVNSILDYVSTTFCELQNNKEFLNTVAKYEDVDFNILSKITLNHNINKIGRVVKPFNNQKRVNLLIDIYHILVTSIFLIEKFYDHDNIISIDRMLHIKNIITNSENLMETDLK